MITFLIVTALFIWFIILAFTILLTILWLSDKVQYHRLSYRKRNYLRLYINDMAALRNACEEQKRLCAENFKDKSRDNTRYRTAVFNTKNVINTEYLTGKLTPFGGWEEIK